MNPLRSVVVLGLILLVVALLLVGGLGVRSAFRTAVSTPLARLTQTPNQGAAHYAFGALSAGFSVQVEKVERTTSVPGLSSPLASTQYVLVHLSFQNTSSSQQRAEPQDFQMRNSDGTLSAPIFASSPPCQAWPKTDLVPANDRSGRLRDADAARAGPIFGPVTLCFQAKSSPSRALTLIWDPDVSIGFLSSPTEIPLQ